MAAVDTAERVFHVHARHEGRHASHRVEGRSFEDAAVAFVERWAPAVDADGDVSVLVAEGETGAEHCFTINLAEGEASPCG